MHIILRCLLTLLFSLSGSAIGEYNAFGHSSFVVATPALQQAYVAEVEGLQGLGSSARAAGQNAEATARMLHAERRALGIQYKDLTPADDLLRITERNIKK